MKTKTQSSTKPFTILCPACMKAISADSELQAWHDLDAHVLSHQQAEIVALALAKAITSLMPTRDMHGNYVPETWN